MKTKLSYFIFPFLALVLPFSLYLKTLAPSYIPIDSAEFALCMEFWGLCHPPGFPLYIAIGHFFVQYFPIGTLIFKANLLSAIFGALTVFIVYLSLLELKVSRINAFLLSLFLAVNAIFWEFSLSADVFTFAAFLISLSVYSALRGRALLSFLILGLSASHFYISAVLWPVFAWYFLRVSSIKYQVSSILGKVILWGVVFVLGFFPQAILFWRMQEMPEINWGHGEGFWGFWYYVRRKEFGSIFLLANPALTFHLGKTVKHFYLYFQNLFVTFGVILPVLPLVSVFFGQLRNRKFVFLLISFAVMVCVQLFLLSTIDPTGEANPFQINKFYLSSFVFAVLLMGIAVEGLVNKFFGAEKVYAYILISFLIVIYLLANIRVNNYSANRFSDNMVLDGLSQLPEDSIAVTVSHIFYFGGIYEQKMNGKFPTLKLLYFPNEKNRDGERYYPELFSGESDSKFVDKVRKNRNLGAAEKYILGVIAKNTDKKIYILQGTFEEGFFGYLKPYIRPYGFWWKVEPDLTITSRAGESRVLFEDLKNSGLTADSLELKQQKLDLLTYAVSFHSTAIALGAEGKYDEAIELLDKSRVINPNSATNIQNEIDLLKKTEDLEGSRQEFLTKRDLAQGPALSSMQGQSLLLDNLKTLGNNYFTLGNFTSCGSVFGEVLKIESSAEAFNNLASCQASMGKVEDAKVNYKKALEIDPNFDLAKKGLKALE